MASPAASPDTLITLKVNFEGTTRRCKLPLRDMGASTLEDKVRSFLGIQPDTECIIERFSDSAATYVVLDAKNVSVYKQLFRAAKAKQKLKLRVVAKEPDDKKVPKPVTVEDVPEQSAPSLSRSQQKEVAAIAKAIAAEDFTVDAAAARRDLLAHIEKVSAPDSNTSPEEARLRYLTHRRNLSEILHEVTVTKDHILIRAPTGVAGRVAPKAAAPDSAATNSTDDRSTSPVETLCPATGASFAVCCNSCDKTIPDSHYHCSKCDDGDFDLCQGCVDQGITCYGDDHWLIKREVKNGQIISSTTETIAPRPRIPEEILKKLDQAQAAYAPNMLPFLDSKATLGTVRTCNSCVGEYPEQLFLHCTTCEDYDLCKKCFAKDAHGHHPKHGFVPAVEGTLVADSIALKLSPGRNQIHNAICDGCDKFITGVRNKCLDCPDWDYCADCVVNANFVHPNHRFVPVYEPLSETGIRSSSRPVHFGICCDGPLCATASGVCPPYITGLRFKCAVCHDTDFCANCEASPANTHNKTHPLIKFRTPVRHVSVTTTGERGDGKRLPAMGDKSAHTRTSSRSTETTPAPIAVNSIQTVVDVKPSEPAVVKAEEVKEIKQETTPAPATPQKQPSTLEELCAVYVRDTVTDGTVLDPNHVFEQTWVLRNAGTVAWPAGCLVKFVGGDYMGNVDSSSPAAIPELDSSCESTVCSEPLAPGQEFPFTVLLRTPARQGKIISYWRLTTQDGFKFGHRLWCDVSVQSPLVEQPTPVVEEPKEESIPETQASSQMIFPTLEKESPVASIHEAVEADVLETHENADEDEDCWDEEWEGSDADDGFMTDDEYDILDASDEEYLVQQQKLVKK